MIVFDSEKLPKRGHKILIYSMEGRFTFFNNLKSFNIKNLYNDARAKILTYFILIQYILKTNNIFPFICMQMSFYEKSTAIAIINLFSLILKNLK